MFMVKPRLYRIRQLLRNNQKLVVYDSKTMHATSVIYLNVDVDPKKIDDQEFKFE
jgi:hypothetical protein